MAEKPNLNLQKTQTTLITMKPILLLPLAALFTSCAALTTPIYLNVPGSKTTEETVAETIANTLANPTTAPVNQTRPTTRSRTTNLPSTLPRNRATPRQVTPPTIRRTGNFVQPDVLTIPKKADLKETATSTEKAPPPPSVTIPGAE